MLEVTRSQSIEFGLTRWELLAPLKPAYEATRAEFQDETLMWSKRMQLREQILQENQPIMIENEAYIVKRCLCTFCIGYVCSILLSFSSDSLVLVLYICIYMYMFTYSWNDNSISVHIFFTNYLNR